MSLNPISDFEREQPKEVREPETSDSLAKAFSLEVKLSDFEGGWAFYQRLTPEQRVLLRNFRSTNHVIDFPNYFEALQRSRPCGIAYKVGKARLMDMINEELKTLDAEERKSYLNGGLLIFQI